MSDGDLAARVVQQCRRLHAAIDAFDQQAADGLGVSRTELRCLNLLEHGPVAPGALAAALGLTSGSVTALIDRLEGKGLVSRARSSTDRRGLLVAATPTVFASLGVVYRDCAERLAAMVAGYPDRQRKLAIKVLSDTADAWSPDPDGRRTAGSAIRPARRPA